MCLYCKTFFFFAFQHKSLNTLSRKSLKQVIHSLVLCQLYNCGTSLCGLPNSSLCELNAKSTRFCCKANLKQQFDSATECLIALLWLPSTNRIFLRPSCMSQKMCQLAKPPFLFFFFYNLNPFSAAFIVVFPMLVLHSLTEKLITASLHFQKQE